MENSNISSGVVVVYVVKYWDMIDRLSLHYIQLKNGEKNREDALRIINLCGTSFDLYYMLVNNERLGSENPASVFFSLMNVSNHISFNDPGIRLIFEDLSRECINGCVTEVGNEHVRRVFGGL